MSEGHQVDEVLLSIVVVAYRQQEALLQCLSTVHVAASEVPGPTELIVVDNGSLSSVIRTQFPGAKLIEPGFNTGFAGGAVRGVAAAEGQWIAVVNDDAVVEPDALRLLLAAGGRSPSIGAVAAQVRFSAARDRINSAGIAVDRLGIATERLAGALVATGAEPAEVFGASACCALYRRAMLAQVGGFEVRFFAYLEDVDLAWRARAAGWSCLYEPHAIAYHRGSVSASHGSPQKYFLVGRNRVWLLARNATTRQLLQWLPAILAYDFAYVVYVAVTDRTLAPLRGRLAGLRTWRRQRRAQREHRRPVQLDRLSLTAALSQHRAYRKLAR